MIKITRAEKSRTSDQACWHRPAGSPMLVSLWDMLRINSEDFAILLARLESMKTFPSHMVVALWDGKKDDNCNRIWEYTNNFLHELRPICMKLELDLAVTKIERICNNFGNDLTYEFKDLEAALRELGERIEDQMRVRMFMFVPTNDTKYFSDSAPLFGSVVHASFPEMTADVEDAGFCLGVGRWTAAVYHLMRVMECALVKLTLKLHIVIHDIEHKTWGEILNSIDTAVAALPKKTKDQESFSEAAIHLRQVKNAWRDPTMHNRRRYDQAEAEAIFQSVRTFAVHLTTI